MKEEKRDRKAKNIKSDLGKERKKEEKRERKTDKRRERERGKWEREREIQNAYIAILSSYHFEATAT